MINIFVSFVTYLDFLSFFYTVMYYECIYVFILTLSGIVKNNIFLLQTWYILNKEHLESTKKHTYERKQKLLINSPPQG